MDENCGGSGNQRRRGAGRQRRAIGQGVAPEIRPCPSEGVLFTLYLFLSISNRILLIDLQQKQPKMLQVGVFYRGPRAKTAKNAAGHSVLLGTWRKKRQKRCRSWCFTGDLEQKTAKTLQVVAGNGVRLVGNAARRMARRAAKWLCIRGMLKTNRPILPIYFQEVAEYQQDRCPANAAACGGLADGECRYRDAVFFGGTDLPFPRRGGKQPRRERKRGKEGV